MHEPVPVSGSYSVRASGLERQRFDVWTYIQQNLTLLQSVPLCHVSLGLRLDK